MSLASAPAVEVASLLDVLPCRAGRDAGSWQQVEFGLPQPVAACALRLCASLAWVEARLTGAECVPATLRRTDGEHQAVVAVPRTGHVAAWCDALATALPTQPGMPQSSVWSVVDPELADAEPVHALSSWCIGDDGKARIEVRFRAPLSAEAIGLLAEAALRVYVAMATDGDATLEALDPLDPAQRQRQLSDWNATAVARPAAESVLSRFASIRAAHADARAVVDDDCALSYAELDQRAGALAARLRAAGVVPGAVVAVAMPRSAAAVVAVLGVLKAGAAYLPLDASHPPERLAFMLADAGARVVVINTGGCQPDWPATVQCLRVDASDAQTLLSDTSVADADIDGEALAYVM